MKSILIALTCLMMLGCESSSQEKAIALNGIIKDCPEGSKITVEAHTSWWNVGVIVTCKYTK